MRDFSLETVWLRSLSGVLELARVHGVPMDALLHDVGIAPADVTSTSARVSLPQVRSLFQNVERLFPDDEPGLRAAEQVSAAELDLHHYAGASLGTVGKALDAFARTIRLLNTAASADVHRADVVTLSLNPGTLADAPRAMHDYFVFTPLFGLRRITSSPLPLLSARLTGPQPRRPERYAVAFGCPVSFLASDSALTFASSVDRQETIAPDPALAALLGRLVDDMMGSLPKPEASLLEQLQAMIGQHLMQGDVSVEWAAARLTVSTRTLQRRLLDEGLPAFREIVDDTRRMRARELLTTTARELADIAHELGYADVRAFHRACRRWFDDSPAELRKATRQRR